jgi:hypothetical protein
MSYDLLEGNQTISTSISGTSLDCVGAILSMGELGRGLSPSRAVFGLGDFVARQEARKGHVRCSLTAF